MSGRGTPGTVDGPDRLCVVGLGYIGLPTAILFAQAGHEVLGVDIDPARLTAIAAGRVPFAEPGLQQALTDVALTGRLSVSARPARADVYLIAVPTPFLPSPGIAPRAATPPSSSAAIGRTTPPSSSAAVGQANPPSSSAAVGQTNPPSSSAAVGQANPSPHSAPDLPPPMPDLSAVRAAAEAIAPHLVPGSLVILESTVPVGATARLAHWLSELRPDLGVPGRDVHVAHCPERVLPGRILEEVKANDRVIGGLTEEAGQRAAALYGAAIKGACHVTDAATAELAKLAENAYRDVNIAFANELSLVCDRVGVDIWQAITLANRHPRVNILQPGPGVGGHCIAVDPWFLAASAPEEARLIQTARRINDAKPDWVTQRALSLVAAIPRPTIACFGLSYKADVDDLRESPSVEIVQHLLRAGRGTVLVVEPHLRALPPGLQGAVLTDAMTALAEADLAVLLVDHAPFRALDPSLLVDIRILDTRGVWQGAALSAAKAASAPGVSMC